ncbi:MAG: hypothetical protein JW712_01105 [Dehalococcoidales bacterium]|nr:hypothetical protein [Dehalococcoidales bacterium]
MYNIIESTLKKVVAFENEAHKILGTNETSRSRIITLEHSYKQLIGLTIQQESLFREALRCIENQTFYAAHVMAWAGFIDYLETLMLTKFSRVAKAEYSKWPLDSIDELREQVPEYQLITACRKIKILSKNEEKALQGLLSIRNECAHPSSYSPDLNESLGYVSQLFNRISNLQKKHP